MKWHDGCSLSVEAGDQWLKFAKIPFGQSFRREGKGGVPVSRKQFGFLFSDNFLIGCAPNLQSLIEKSRVERGEKIFSENCNRCHGNEARGKIGPSLVVPKVKDDLEKEKEGGFVEETVKNGRGRMPSFGDKLSHDEIHDVLTYLRFFQED